MRRALVALSLLVACTDAKDEPDPTPQVPESPFPTSAAPAHLPPQAEQVVPTPPPPPPPDAPPSAPTADAAPPQDSEPIDVILEGGTIKIGRRRVTEAQLITIFEKAAARDPRTQIIIKVMGSVSRARKDKIVRDAEAAGLERVGTMELGTTTRRKKATKKKRR